MRRALHNVPQLTWRGYASRASTRNGRNGRAPTEYIKQLYLKVHPDLYQKQAEAMQVNQDSMARLNSLLEYHRNIRPGVAGAPNPIAGALQAPPNTKLVFFCHNNTPTAHAHAASATHSASSPLRKIETHVKFGGSYKSAPVAWLERVRVTIETSVADLLKQAQVPVVEADARRWHREWRRVQDTYSNLQKKTVSQLKADLYGLGPAAKPNKGTYHERATMHQAEQRTFVENVGIFEKEYENLSEVHETEHPRVIVPALMAKYGLVKYCKTLSASQRALAQRKFSEVVNKHFEALHVFDWLGTGVLFAQEFRPPQQDHWTVAWNFNASTLIHYVSTYLGQMKIHCTEEKLMLAAAMKKDAPAPKRMSEQFWEQKLAADRAAAARVLDQRLAGAANRAMDPQPLVSKQEIRETFAEMQADSEAANRKARAAEKAGKSNFSSPFDIFSLTLLISQAPIISFCSLHDTMILPFSSYFNLITLPFHLYERLVFLITGIQLPK
eukprot:g63710.t1